MKLYWWDRVPNLGDVVGKLLLERFGYDVERAGSSQADWFATGSILERADGTTATIWGSGRFGQTYPPTDLHRANVLALRGRRTAEYVTGIGEVAYGDPGLLVDELIPHRGGEGDVIVPHWEDQSRMRADFPHARFVDVTGDPWEALEAIAGADRVISSSFHGVVFADAYGIPRMWQLTTAHPFKFLDHGTVVGFAPPDVWFTADPSTIAETKEVLRTCLSTSVPA
jgi:pyruvyltransferase